MITRFRDRSEAGKLLAQQLQAYRNCPDVVVLGLPRGGVPVAFEIARSLNAPLDLCLVRKLGVPTQQELAMGAIALGGVRVINREVVDWLNIPNTVIETVTAEEEAELHRRDRLYRGHRPPPPIENQTIILVDDGLATGSTMRAAIAALQKQQPEYLIVAVPVAPVSVYQQLSTEVDQVVCLLTPEAFQAIGIWYEDFTQITDEQVRDCLEQASFSGSVDR